jgi:hypothetical protein
MKTLNPYFKGAAVGPLSEVLYANQQNYKNFTFRVLPEKLFSVPVVMYFPKNHYLKDQINSKTNILSSAGLINRWTSNYLWPTPAQNPQIGPKTLTVGQLAGGIFVYAGGCGLAIFGFISEVVFKRLRM